MLVLLFVTVFVASGLFLADWLLKSQPLLRRLWLGLVLGLFLWTWFPSIISFFIGFTLLSNLISLELACALLVISVIMNRKRLFKGSVRADTVRTLLLLLPVFAIGAYLFHTHILLPEDGCYFVGQTTYGDLSMHLGFIGSIAKQGLFPPQYSIFPGHTVNYPFLCETSSASLVILGADLRSAYLIPAIYAYVLVILGVYFFFEQWLKRRARALFATCLFFFGGGFGFWYFLDLAGDGYTLLSSVITDMQAGSSLQYLLDGFYHTPTNLPALGLRWVNPIVDMLIPQRATLFGWAFLFPCLYLLFGFAFRNERRNVLPLAVLAGGLPLIHTHSYVALAIISGGYFLFEVIRGIRKERLLAWLLYGGIAGLLGIFQLIPFAFAQASESGMLQLHFNWCNTSDSYLWFYLKNLGMIAILTPAAFLLLTRRTRRICAGPLLLWAVSECVVFQPNTYDNNKLLFVCFAFACGLTAKLIGVCWRRIRLSLSKRFTPQAQEKALRIGSLVLYAVSFLSMLLAALRAGDGMTQVRVSRIGTLLVFGILSISLSGCSAICPVNKRRIPAATRTVICFALQCLLLVILLQQYASQVILISRIALLSLLTGYAALLLLTVAELIIDRSIKSGPGAWMRVASQCGACALCICLFLSGVMTIMREVKSKYVAFDQGQIAAASFVDEQLEADAVFLTDYSWHLNPVSVLTGRSIVCGPGLYLFYHGIDTTERQSDVKAMFEQPTESQDLFEKYHVSYVYVGASEKGNYLIDTAYFEANGCIVYESDGICIYRID